MDVASEIVPLLAVSDEVWITAIGAIVAIAGSYFAAKRAVQAESKVFTAKVEETTTVTNEKIDDANQKIDKVADKVEVVRHATNSLTEQLVAKTEAEALSRGGVEERARADAIKAREPATTKEAETKGGA